MLQQKKDTLQLILNRAMSGEALDMDEICFLLSVDDQEGIELLHRVARTIRKRYFDNKIFMYGFIYFSTHCRNNCTFCHFRASHTALERYRKPAAEILETARQMARSGVHLIDLTMGEDPQFYKHPRGLNELVEIVAAIARETNLPVMISPGTVPEELFPAFKDAGACFYACYQETHNRKLFDEIRQGQNYDERYNSKLAAKQSNMLIEEGLLCGIGDTIEDTAHSLFKMKSMDADQIRAMTFVPQQGTPLEHHTPGNPQKELITISVMRILFPDRLIPASLDVDGLAGLKQRLYAGANVITSLVPPGKGLAGVAHSALDIEDARRTPESILPILNECGLTPASCEEFKQWIKLRKASSRPTVLSYDININDHGKPVKKLDRKVEMVA